MLKRTALYEIHQNQGARLVEFGGWEMPVQYSSIIDEHLCVRQSSGIFDISHMGEFRVSGADSEAFVNWALSNDVRALSVGEGQYTLLCLRSGGVVDDLYIFRVAENDFLWVVNASRIESVARWLETLQAEAPWANFSIANESDSFGAVAVQGPRVVDFIEACLSGGSDRGAEVDRVTALKKNQMGRFEFGGESVWVSRTGYTGEDGFEVVGAKEIMPEIWQSFMAEGHRGCLQPIGLGARDTLRTEMGYPLYGHELSETITPLEAGLGFFVKLDKEDFVGHAALKTQKAAGLTRRSVGFKMTGKAPPPRPDYPVTLAGEPVGVTTSGSLSPSLKTGIGLAMVDLRAAKVGTELGIEIRGRSFPAVVVKKPIYSRTDN